MLLLNLRSLPRNNRHFRREISHNGVPRTEPKNFINKVKNMLEANITKAPNFIKISLSSTKKSSLKSVHQLLNDLISTESSIFLYKQHLQRCFDVTEYRVYKTKPPKCKNNHQKMFVTNFLITQVMNY